MNLLAVFLLGVAWAGQLPCSSDPPKAPFYQVDRVVDGDTVNLKAPKGHYSIRILGIDTPEKWYKGQTQGEWANKATNSLASLLPTDTWVELVFDVEKCDRFGRVLAYVQIRKGSDVGRVQLERGLAVNYCIFPNILRCEDYSYAVKVAQSQDEGFWTDPKLVTPYVWRLKVSGREPDKWVGSISSHQVYGPKFMDDVEIADRIFFTRKKDIQPPWTYAP